MESHRALDLEKISLHVIEGFYCGLVVKDPTAASWAAVEEWVQSLTWELLYAMGIAIKRKKKKSACSSQSVLLS